MKKAVVEELDLRFTNLEKPFEVWIDTSDHTISRVLMQEGCPIAIESRKLNDTKRRYFVHEKKMTTVVHC